MGKNFVIQTQSGNTFDPKTGEITGVDINDVALSLSHMCRYAGHCREMYTVAEHSVLVSRIVRALWPTDVMARWAGLLHDATEAYVCDLPTQIKSLLPGYVAIEEGVAEEVAQTFGIEWDSIVRDKVKLADSIALSTEARLLFDNGRDWETIQSFKPMPELLHESFPQPPASAKKEFLREFQRVQEEVREFRKI